MKPINMVPFKRINFQWLLCIFTNICTGHKGYGSLVIIDSDFVNILPSSWTPKNTWTLFFVLCLRYGSLNFDQFFDPGWKNIHFSQIRVELARNYPHVNSRKRSSNQPNIINRGLNILNDVATHVQGLQ